MPAAVDVARLVIDHQTVADVLEALIESSASRRFVDLSSRCERPEPVPLGVDESVFGR